MQVIIETPRTTSLARTVESSYYCSAITYGLESSKKCNVHLIICAMKTFQIAQIASDVFFSFLPLEQLRNT